MNDARWHVGRWPALAWIETAIKLAAAGIAVYGLTQGAPPAGAWRTGAVIALAVLGLLAGGLVPAIWDRFRNREVVSTIFGILNGVGHWSAFAVLLSARSVTPPLINFAALMLVGDVVKISYIRRTGPAAGGPTSGRLIALTLVYVIGYAAVFGLSAA